MRDRSPTRPLLKNAVNSPVNTVGLFSPTRLAALRDAYINENDLVMRVFDMIIFNNSEFLKYITVEAFFRLFLVSPKFYVRLLDVLNNPALRIDNIVISRQLVGVEKQLMSLLDEKQALIRGRTFLNGLYGFMSLLLVYGQIDKDLSDYHAADYGYFLVYLVFFAMMFFTIDNVINFKSADSSKLQLDYYYAQSDMNVFKKLRQTFFKGSFFRSPSERDIFIQQLKNIRPEVVSADGEVIINVSP